MTIINIEQLAETIVTSASRGVVRVSAKVSSLGLRGLSQVMKISAQEVKKLPHVPGSPDHGKMTIKALQKKTGGDLHAQQLDQSLIKDIQKDLKKRGVDFAIERGHDGHTYIHFSGSDTDAMSHAIDQVRTKIDKNIEAKRKPQTRADVTKKIETIKIEKKTEQPKLENPAMRKGLSR